MFSPQAGDPVREQLERQDRQDGLEEGCDFGT